MSFQHRAARHVFVLILSLTVHSAHATADATSPFSALEAIVGQDWSQSELSHSFDPRNVVGLFDELRSRVGAVGRIPDYDRSTDFGSWIYPDPTICKNTRALILIRDADRSVSVQYTNSNECSLLGGLWHDSYTGRDFKKARDLDIDHVVPLHNAWESGAYRWDEHRRCHYANFMQNNIHLRAVSSAQNRAKGDKTPADYMPEDRAAACQYLSDWMKIKAIWEMNATQTEVAAVESLFRSNRCAVSLATIPTAELMTQRQLSQIPQKACVESYNQPYYRPEGA